MLPHKYSFFYHYDTFLFCIWQYIFWCLVTKAYKNHYWKEQKLNEDFHANKMSFLTHSLSNVLATFTIWELDFLSYGTPYIESSWHLHKKTLVFLHNKRMMPRGKKLDLHTGKYGVSAFQTLKYTKRSFHSKIMPEHFLWFSICFSLSFLPFLHSISL
jgi:hypothetical protein